MKTIDDVKDQIGVESYPVNRSGGQVTGKPSSGVRLWYPNIGDPIIDIRIHTERSQLKNRDIALTMLELILEDL